ncbi:ankyrin, partial [Anaeromyces robustus]
DLSLKGANGDNALIRAAQKGCFDVVEKLLHHRVNINSTNDFNRTALMEAAENGYLRVVKLLLKKGAKPSIKDNFGKT